LKSGDWVDTKNITLTAEQKRTRSDSTAETLLHRRYTHRKKSFKDKKLKILREATIVLELALWKHKIQNGEQRDIARIRSEADVIIPNVVEYLVPAKIQELFHCSLFGDD